MVISHPWLQTGNQNITETLVASAFRFYSSFGREKHTLWVLTIYFWIQSFLRQPCIVENYSQQKKTGCALPCFSKRCQTEHQPLFPGLTSPWRHYISNYRQFDSNKDQGIYMPWNSYFYIFGGLALCTDANEDNDDNNSIFTISTRITIFLCKHIKRDCILGATPFLPVLKAMHGNIGL